MSLLFDLSGGGNIRPEENSMDKVGCAGKRKDLGMNFLFWLGWVFIAVSITGICICCRQSEKEALTYQEIAEACKAEQAREAGDNGHLAGDGEEKEAVKDIEREAAEAEKETGEDSVSGEEQKWEPRLWYDWGELLSINRNVLGWLYIPGSRIDFPVVGAEDNSFYLSHDISGAESRSGCLFMDKDTDMSDFNRVIYGHNMGKGSEAMFSTLISFKDKDYFDRNYYFCFTETGSKVSVYKIIAVVEYDIKDVEEWDFRVRNHETEAECLAFMKEIEERALYYRGEPGVPERLMTLATCDRSEHGKDGRLLVIGVPY